MKIAYLKNYWKPAFVLLGTVFFIMSCGSSQHGGNRQGTAQLQNWIANEGIIIENQWAMPLRGQNINLIGNPNFIKLQGDSVHVFLPYFGVRHSGGFGTEGGIKYEGIAEELQITRNLGQNSLLVVFEGDQGSENLKFYITLFPNGKSSTEITSSQRDAISYRGNVKPLPEAEKGLP